MALLWGKTETMALIQLYHAKSCLWKVTEVDYRNQSKRKSALEDIALKMQSVRPGTTAKEVQTKINGLRTQFSEQLRKQRKRCGLTDPYTKVLWCFESLQFLRDSVVPRPVTSNDCPTEDDAAREASEQDDEEDDDDGDDDLVEESTEPWTCVDVNVTSPNSQQIQMPPPSRRKRKAENATFYDTVIASMLRIAEMSTKSAATVSAAASSATNNSTAGVAAAATSTAVTGDNYAVFGAYIAGELRSLRDPVQQHLAQMDIQRVIFKRKCAVLRIPHHSKSEWTSSSTDGHHNRLGDCCSVNCSPGEEYDVDEADDDDDCDDPVT